MRALEVQAPHSGPNVRLQGIKTGSQQRAPLLRPNRVACVQLEPHSGVGMGRQSNGARVELSALRIAGRIEPPGIRYVPHSSRWRRRRPSRCCKGSRQVAVGRSQSVVQERVKAAFPYSSVVKSSSRDDCVVRIGNAVRVGAAVSMAAESAGSARVGMSRRVMAATSGAVACSITGGDPQG